MIEKNFWNEMRRFKGNMNRFFAYPDFPESFDEQERPANYRRAWVNSKETADSFEIVAEIPGIDKEDIKVNIVTGSNVIEIKAEKKVEKKQDDCCEDDACYCSYSKAYSGFYRAINMPENADLNTIDAECKDGILKLTIGKLKSSVKDKKEVRVR